MRKHDYTEIRADRRARTDWSGVLFPRISCRIFFALFWSNTVLMANHEIQGLGWCDFLSQYEDRRASSIVSGHRLSQPFSTEGSRRSSGQSIVTIAPSGLLSPDVSKDLKDLSLDATKSADGNGQPTLAAVASPKRPTLQRHQTFDSTSGNGNQQGIIDDELLSAASAAHSNRSHSCIAPVDVSIRRLSGGMNLVEESSFDVAAEDTQEEHSAEEKDRPLSPPPLSLPPIPSGGSSTRSSFAVSRSEHKRREALWDLFQSECAFLYDHLMVLKNVFMEPLKKIQVEGFAMFAEPEVLFGNLDELCCVTYAFCKEFLSIILHQMSSYEVNATEALVKLFQKVCYFLDCFPDSFGHNQSITLIDQRDPNDGILDWIDGKRMIIPLLFLIV